MKVVTTLLLFLVISLMPGSAARGEHQNHIGLPNANLLQCTSDRSKLWQDGIPRGPALYPVQLRMDRFDGNGCPRGIVALYGKAVSLDDISSAVDQRYRKWAKAENAALPVKLWRVESENIAIQLSTVTSGHKGELGMKQLIYLRFTQSQDQETAR